MDEYEFEQLVADVWERRGWKTRVTRGSNDRGIDIIASKSTPFEQKHLIQAKRYGKDNKIGSPDIQQYSSLRHQEDGVDAVAVVTTSSFTKQARETARDLNVKLVDGRSLYQILQEVRGEDILDEYLQLRPRRETEDDSKSRRASQQASAERPADLSGVSTETPPNPEELVENARGDSVTVKRLTLVGTSLGLGYLDDEPAIEYLDSREQPHYFFYNESKGVRVGDEKISTGWTGDYRGSMWVTDTGVHFFQGREREPDYHQFLPYKSIKSVETESGITKNRMTFETLDEEYTFFTDPSLNELHSASRYIRSKL